MNRDLFERWVDALDSAGYRKCTHNEKLVAEGGEMHCAMGVAADLAHLNWTPVTMDSDPKELRDYGFTDAEIEAMPWCDCLCPSCESCEMKEYAAWEFQRDELAEALGLDEEEMDELYSAVASLNDDGSSFHEIALYLKEYWLK